MKMFIKKLKERQGNALILACAIVISLILILSVLCEYIRLQMIAKGVRDALQTAVISIAVQNYDDLYNGLREGYSGGYVLTSFNRWESKIDTGDVYSHLEKSLGLKKESNCYVKLSGNLVEYRISGIKVDLINPPIAPRGDNNLQQFKAESYLNLEVPLSFGWSMLPPMKIKLKVVAGYTPKF
ncbi:UNVERIFIED_CONTAM: hypothetical protein Cloal_0221 [Acetivibrio alkalicellulosi]